MAIVLHPFNWTGPIRTRFAPSPTGYLHLGHAASALAVWGLAESLGAKVLLRIEDHDRQRCRPEYTTAILEDLALLGFYRANESYSLQSSHPERYAAALTELKSQGRVYACSCSRRDIALRAGMTEATGELYYDGHCREQNHPWEGHALRFRLPSESIEFFDLEQGTLTQTPSEQCGDFVLRDKQGNWTYNFCVAVDDRDEGIELVIRGIDLLSATGRQLLLAQALGSRGPKAFYHHPLILEENGLKLSKRYGSTALRSLAQEGLSREQLLGMAAFAVGYLTQEGLLRREDIGGIFS